jgi:hypothetical protein
MERTTELFGSSLKYWYDVAAIELRNIEAFGLAQQKILDGWGQLAKHQAEISQGMLSRSFDLKGPGSLAERIDSLKTSILESQANSNILTELAVRSSGEAASILQSRLLASLDELKAALAPVALAAVQGPVVPAIAGPSGAT